MRLRPIPKKPKRLKKVEKTFWIDYNMNLQSIMRHIGYYFGEDVSFEEVTIYVDWDDHEVSFKWTRPETDGEYNARLESYKKKLKKYEEWYRANKEEIEEEICNKKAVEVEKYEKYLITEEARLQKRLKELGLTRRKQDGRTKTK